MLEFRKKVWAHYKKNGRHDLPWRKTRDPYKILVSEVMLQQTQVERVVHFYKNFLEQFPTAKALAAASLAEVLKSWQGLGYNRRAKMLQAAAREVVEKNKGKFPKTPEELEELPGVGPYTARAIAAFAYNQDVIFIETNIRTVVTHHFFGKKKKVSDTEVLKILTSAFPTGKSREWYAALMDYGTYLKKSGVRINAKSKHYTKQKQFSGSLRQARGAILKELSRGSATELRLLGLLGDDRVSQMEMAITALQKENFIEKRGKSVRLSESPLLRGTHR